MYIQFDVKFPDRIGSSPEGGMTDADIAALEKVLPPRMQSAMPPADVIQEEVSLEDLSAQEHGRGRGQAFDEDDEDVPPGAERVQCASQ